MRWRARDPGHPERRNTLIAQRGMHDGRPVYIFDIHLQGPAETVLFDI